MRRRMMRGLLAATFAAAMGFGGAQAMAAPAAAEASVAARCDPEACAQRCAREGLTGLCSGRGCYCR